MPLGKRSRTITKTRRTPKKYKPLSKEYKYAPMSKKEEKSKDTDIGETTVATTGTIITPSVCLVDVGSGTNEMVGRKIEITKISVHFDAIQTAEKNSNLNNLATAVRGRFWLVLDRQANGAAPTFSQIFDNSNIFTFNNLSNSYRFTILKEWNFELNMDAEYNGDNLAEYYHSSHSCYGECHIRKLINVEFSPQDSINRVVGEIKTNNIFFCGISRGRAFKVDGKIRIRYTDA